MGNEKITAVKGSSEELADQKLDSKQDVSGEDIPELTSLETKVRSHVSVIENFCQRENIDFKIPLLALGTFERVGSNWFLSTVSQHAHTHNEPFKQQLAATSVFSPKAVCLDDVSSSQSVENGFGEYWLQTFVASKYGSKNHVVKEISSIIEDHERHKYRCRDSK